jgi:tetratricopeptide (TPR) repeat protein
MSTGYYHIGSIYTDEDEWGNALNYFLKSYRIDYVRNDSDGVSANCNALGLVYENLGNSDSALFYYSSSLEINTAINDLDGISGNLNNLGILYDNLGEYDKALDFYQRSLALDIELNDAIGKMGSYCNIGSIYSQKGDYTKALGYFNKALQLREEVEYLDYLSIIYEELYVVHKELGNYKESLAMHEKFMITMDSLYNLESQRILVTQETKYRFEKEKILEDQKELEEARLRQLEMDKRNNVQYMGISFGIFFLFTLLFVVGKFKLPKWGIELFTFLPFLILFEFILVWLDAYIEIFTDGIPIYKLFVNVVIAGLIFPVHGFFERFLKSRIFRKD